MQFLPSTWRRWGVDRHGRMLDPQDIRAAAMAAAGYLCASGRDLTTPGGIATAVYSYNHSYDYVRLVLSIAARYAGLTPAALGVDRLPHDKPPSRKHATTKKAKPKGSAPATPAPSSAAPAASGSQQGSPQSTQTPTPAPTPSGGSSTGPLPLPTAPPTVGFVH
jgi:hypothetical protein